MNNIRVSFVLFFLVLSSFGISSCDNQSETALLQEKLIGDWTSLDTCKDLSSELCRNQLLLSFEKDVFRLKNASKKRLVKLNNRHLYIKTPAYEERSSWFSYRIVYAGKRFLKIKAEGKFTKDYLSTLLNRPYNGETITLRKCRKRNSIQPKKVVFYATTCYGTCPSFFLEINADKSMRYLGISFTKGGAFTKNISQQELKRLVRRIRQLPHHNMIDDYSYCIADAQVYYLTIFYNNTHISFKTDLCRYTPPELQYLIYDLLDLGTDTTELIKSKTPFFPSDFELKNHQPYRFLKTPEMTFN